MGTFVLNLNSFTNVDDNVSIRSAYFNFAQNSNQNAIVVNLFDIVKLYHKFRFLVTSFQASDKVKCQGRQLSITLMLHYVRNFAK